MVMKYHLITTADERTWRFDRPVIFLGEWCRIYERQAIWNRMDVIVADPYKLSIENKLRMTDYVLSLTSQLLTDLAEALNVIHNTDHTTRYWNILLGHWLNRYVKLCFNRYFTIDQLLKSYQIMSTTGLEDKNYSLVVQNSYDFVLAISDDAWNSIFYSRVLDFIDCKSIEVDSVPIGDQKAFKMKRISKLTSNLNAEIMIKSVLGSVLPSLSRENDAFIINSYMPALEEMKLYVYLSQCPQKWKSPALNESSIDQDMRRGLTVSNESVSGFEKFVRDTLPEIIPICYLEGYAKLNEQVKSLRWPSKPKFIFTSNNFDTDEIFKAWTGLMVEQGVPYFTGQHGNYQAYPELLNYPEIVSCDKFFTWGWANKNLKIIPAFGLKIANQPSKTKANGGLLLIERGAPYVNLDSLDDYYCEFGNYQEQQFRFVEALPQKIRNELTVRLHSSWPILRWSDDKRWRDHILSAHLETGKAPIQSLIAKSRLVVHSYDSTGILEGLASNTPTLCFWHGGLDHLLPSAKPYYELLRGSDILADTPEQAALLVAKHWDDVDGWWKSEQVQSARVKFCDQYARIDSHPARTMKRLLTNAALSKRDHTINDA